MWQIVNIKDFPSRNANSHFKQRLRPRGPGGGLPSRHFPVNYIAPIDIISSIPPLKTDQTYTQSWLREHSHRVWKLLCKLIQWIGEKMALKSERQISHRDTWKCQRKVSALFREDRVVPRFYRVEKIADRTAVKDPDCEVFAGIMGWISFSL